MSILKMEFCSSIGSLYNNNAIIGFVMIAYDKRSELVVKIIYYFVLRLIKFFKIKGYFKPIMDKSAGLCSGQRQQF